MSWASTYDRWSGRGANLASFWPLLPAGAIAVITGGLATGSSLINRYGAFGWWAAALLGLLIATAAMALASYARETWEVAKAARKLTRAVDAINPLDVDFSRRRIKFIDLGHPTSGRVVRKRFTECELLGRANIVLIGNGLLQDCTFTDCDFAIIKDGAGLRNVIPVDACLFIKCEIISCTLLFDQASFNAMIVPLGGTSISYEKSAVAN